jgi:23S rRNA pseudouridine955/2504/2580 synthase
LAREIEVGPVDDGRRLDRFLERIDGGVPPSLVRRLLRQRRVRVNGRRVRDPQTRLLAGDLLEIHHAFEPAPARTDDRVWQLPAPQVLHHDQDYLVISKPAGIACSDDGSDPAALQVWLREHLRHAIASGAARPEPCHRLDRGTTGIVVVALGPEPFDRFRRALQAGRARKVYQVAVGGLPDREEFACDQALARNPRAGRTEPRMVPGDDLRALTEFRLLRSAEGNSLLEAIPVTGRTHQIRAHCLALGLPVIGDPRYGGNDGLIGHQLLHSAYFALAETFEAQAPWPEVEASLLQRLGLTA